MNSLNITVNFLGAVMFSYNFIVYTATWVIAAVRCGIYDIGKR